MKKIILSLFVLSCLVACGPSAEEIAAKEKKGWINPETHNHLVFENGLLANHYSIIKIGNCEYIKGWAGSMDGGPFLTHKGDCSNPIHVYNHINKDSLNGLN